MRKFNKQKLVNSMTGALKLRSQINNVIDPLFKKGIDNICWLGIGGTYASGMQANIHMKERSALETFYQNAAEYVVTGNKRITGNTKEMVDAVKKLNKTGATILGFMDDPKAKLASMLTYCISYPENEQLKFFMVGDRLMYLNGEFSDYDEFYQEMDAHFAQDIADIEENADEFAQKFAEKHHDDEIHYFVGAGNQWGATYSYAMCYWEEQHWIRTRAVEAAEFFHGMFEVVDRDTPVTVYVGEDSQRQLSARVAKFLPEICGNYTIIDSKDYDLPGFSEKYRGTLSPFVFHAINNRIDVHIEHLNRHPMDIRRYYRCLDY